MYIHYCKNLEIYIIELKIPLNQSLDDDEYVLHPNAVNQTIIDDNETFRDIVEGKVGASKILHLWYPSERKAIYALWFYIKYAEENLIFS